MNKSYSITISLLIFLLILVSASTSAQIFTLNSDWQASIFGNIGGDNKITSENFAIQELGTNKVRLMSANNRGKISSSSEGIAYYYQELKPDSNFILTAQATVKNFKVNNQVSFGIMLRDKVLINKSQKKDLGSALALGPLNSQKDIPKIGFYRTESGQHKLGKLVKGAVPSAGLTYQLKLKKFGNTYWLKFGQEEPVIINNFTAFNGKKLYAGLYTARNTDVLFNNLQLKLLNKKIKKLQIISGITKRNYLPGEKLDLAGLKVKAFYRDGSSKILDSTDYIITGFDSSTPGEETVKVNYAGQTVDFRVRIKPLTATALKIKYFPALTNYHLGEKFNPDGLVVQAEFNHGYQNRILQKDEYKLKLVNSQKSLANYRFIKAGQVKIKIIYTAQPALSKVFTVSVNPAKLKALVVESDPVKQIYFPGEKIDLTGLRLYAEYSDGSHKRLTAADYQIGEFDTTKLGEQHLSLSYQDKKTQVPIKIKERELTGLKITSYPATTIRLAEDFSTSGLKVVKQYDNGDQEILPNDQYKIDSSALNNQQAGIYKIKIIPAAKNLASLTFPVTVQPQLDLKWRSINFGQSTSNEKDFIKETANQIEIASLNGGGKVATDHDGISYYYTVISANKNFKLEADIKVINYAKEPHDGQESFGIMARDAIGKAGDTGVFAANIVGVGGFSGGTKSKNGTQLFYRTGVKSPAGAGSNGLASLMLKAEKPGPENTYPQAEYHLSLAKTNSGYLASLNNNQQQLLFKPDLLEVQNDKIYLGFFAARVADIKVSNIKLNISNAATDAPQIIPPFKAVKPELEVLSLGRTANKSYQLVARANTAGTVKIKQGKDIIAAEKIVKADHKFGLLTKLKNNGSNNFTIIFLPDDRQKLTDYSRIIKNYTVIKKQYRSGKIIYAAPSARENATGSKENPLDIDTALAFSMPGQKIVALPGHYIRSKALIIKKYNDGHPDARRYLTTTGGQAVFDFAKKSKGVILSANYWTIENIDVTNSAANEAGMVVGGNNNIVQQSRFYQNGDTGLQISRTDYRETRIEDWPANNLIFNCISFNNADPSNNNADGFAAKLTSGRGNIFRSCISHNNIDDGWDLYTKVGTGAIGKVVIDNCLAYNNGFLTDGTVGNGDKNGFKLGGEGVNVAHLITNSVAFGNGAAGFTSNSNPGVRAVNNLAFNNQGGNIVFNTYGEIEKEFIIESFISLANRKIAADVYPESETSAFNFFFNGQESINSQNNQYKGSSVQVLEDRIIEQQNKSTALSFKELFRLIK